MTMTEKMKTPASSGQQKVSQSADKSALNGKVGNGGSSKTTVDPKYAVLAALGLVPITPLLFKISLPQSEGNNNTNSVNNNHDESVQDSTLQCQECNVFFQTKALLKTHFVEEHQSQLKYYCKICSKLYSTRHLLQKHRDATHNGQKPYTCTLCPLNFVCLEALTAHVRRHNGKLPYSCKICNEGFELYQDLKAHKPIHELKKLSSTQQARKMQTCNICERQFRKPCELERHLRVHTGEKPYVCSVCGNRFQQAHNLTKHMAIHTKEKQYECDLCKKIFGRSDVLTRHMLTHAVQKPHQCDLCPQNFARAAQLADHVNKKHVNGAQVKDKKVPKKNSGKVKNIKTEKV